MLANLEDMQEQQQVQATPQQEQNREPDPGDQEFDQFQTDGAREEKIEGFYGPVVDGDENAEAGSGQQDGQPEQTAQTQQPGTPQTPIRVVRYLGRDVPIYTKEEEEGLLSKGMDYTQKMMALSPWRKRVEFLYQNPDKLQAIDRLMSGEQLPPATLAAPGAENKGGPEKTDDKPVQKDDETFEDYTERLSEWKARQIVKAEMETFRAESARREFQAAALQDPLMPYITKAIEADVQSGFLPEEAFKAADADPTAAAKLYGAYRKRIVSMIETAKANGGGNPQQQQTPQARQPQQPFTPAFATQTQQRTTQQPRRPAPFAESGNGSRRPAAKGLGNVEAQVIRDMSLTDFEAYVDRVKSGG